MQKQFHVVTLSGFLLLIAATFNAADTPHKKTVPATGKIRVFILAGQSNMEGRGFPEPLTWQLSQAQYRHRWKRFIQNGDEQAFLEKVAATRDPQDPRISPTYLWSERDDVWIDYLGKHGNLTVGYGAPQNGFGPEFNFGQVLGDYYEDQVLLIKTAWGGRALARGFLPPSSMASEQEYARQAGELNEQNRQWNDEEPARIEAYNKRVTEENENSDRKKPLRQFKPREMVTIEEYKAQFGKDYRNMVVAVQACLDNLEERFPASAQQEYQIEGFVWFQGWNDQYDQRWLSYEQNLANLIRDVRQSFGAPHMRVVIGQMGHDGMKPDKPGSPRDYIKKAQAAVPKYAEFKTSVTCVPTAPYWDMEAEAIYRGPGGWKADVDRWRQFGNDHPYHYYGSPWFFAQAGTGFGEAMIDLLEKPLK